MKHAGAYVQPTSVHQTVCIPYQGRTVPARCLKGGGTYGRTDCSGPIHALGVSGGRQWAGIHDACPCADHTQPQGPTRTIKPYLSGVALYQAPSGFSSDSGLHPARRLSFHSTPIHPPPRCAEVRRLARSQPVIASARSSGWTRSNESSHPHVRHPLRLARGARSDTRPPPLPPAPPAAPAGGFTSRETNAAAHSGIDHPVSDASCQL